MGQTPWSAVINLSNSIIGVSVLAMPWCFKECGVLLAISLLFVTGIVNKFSCNLLLRSSKATRKTSYETLSHHTLGGMGKLAVEVSVILLLMCTCIAFFVIIGDLGPSLLSKFLGFENTSNLRTSILVGTAVFIILPLAQKRNVESLSALSTISICFYFFFATSVFVDSLPSLLAGEWISKVVFFRPAGLLKGMSIFALSMCCQPTLFAIYNSLQERTPKMMEDVVSKGVNLVAFVYMCIGFFGYITYYQEGIKGDVLLNQPPSMISDGLKLCFALSVALSFPLVVFPCRSSIFSLLFPNADSNVITGATYIPPTMFRIITVVILAITLTIAILIPNVEVVLSITGGTMGSLACFILPALIYQHTVGVPVRFMPKVLLIIGISFMLFSTYDNIRPAPQDNHIPAPAAHVFDKLDSVKKLDEFPVDKVIEKQNIGVDKSAEKMGLQGEDVIKHKDTEFNVGDIMAVEKAVKDTDEEQQREKDEGDEEKRQEPPIPHAPVDVPDSKDKVAEDIAKVEEKEEVQLEIPEKKEGKEEVEEPPKEKKHKKHKEEKEEIVDAAAAKKESKEIAEETEEKFKVQEEKQEIQEKKLEELQARQVIQERLIVKQAEEIDQLKKEHEEDKQMDENLQNAAAQLAQVQVAQAQVAQAQAAQAQVAQQGMGQAVLPAQGQLPQQPVAGGLQQPAGPGIAVQQAAGQPVAGQAVAGQPVAGQPVAGLVGDPQGLGQLGVQQQPLPGQVPVGQLPMGQPVGQIPVAQAQAKVPIGQAAGQLPVAQGQGQLPLGQAAGQPVQLQAAGQLPIGQQPLEPQFQGQLLQQQPVAAGQLHVQDVQVGMQAGAAGGGMGQNVAMQPGGGPQHVGLEGINQGAGMGGVIPQQQQPLIQGGVGQQQQQGVLLDGAGMQAGGGGGALGQANIQQQQFQANVAQQVPLNLQQQQQQQLLQQQQQQQQQLLLQQQQVPVQQNLQPVLQILPDVGEVGAAVGQQQAQQQQGIVGAGDGMANAGFADRNQAPGGAVVEGGIPQHHEPADKMIKAVDVDAILEPGKDLNLAGGVQQRVLNQAENEGNKESEKQTKDEKEGAKNGESDGVVVQVVDEEEDGEEGMGGGNGDAVPALEEEEVRALAVGKKTGDNEDVRIENEGGADDADRGHDDDTKRIGEKKEEEEEIRDKSKKAPVDEEEDPVQAGEEKLLENHLKMIENKEEEEEEEFADQEDVGDDAVAIVRDAEEEGKIEMNQEQEEVPQKAKKDIRSREEV